jgi:hypothetical protein
MSTADSGIGPVRTRLIAAAALVSVGTFGTFGDAFARSPESCTVPTARQLAEVAGLHGGLGLLASARWLTSHRSQPLSEADRTRPVGESAEPLSTAALEARIARYRVGSPDQRLQNAVATATAAAPNLTDCQKDG